ncbi:MAG: hypothetical protein KAJ97_01420 [Acidobacteria bacterium]|nr:hypothetical protein [Acidobacteriota bacterium]
MKNILQLCFVLALGPLLVSCGGSSTLDNTEASVFLTVEIEGYNPDIDICVQLGDVFIEDMKIESSTKDPNGTISANQDVNLNRWVISPYRTDGGSTASPEWIYDQAVFVAAGGTASLSNYRVYPLEFLSEIPLSYLLPENGGFDPETGNTNIRESLQLQIFGRTVSGKSVATEPIPIAFNFFCFGQ